MARPEVERQSKIGAKAIGKTRGFSQHYCQYQPAPHARRASPGGLTALLSLIVRARADLVKEASSVFHVQWTIRDVPGDVRVLPPHHINAALSWRWDC
ncbi:hypothetical protein B0H10DRAFT_2235050 [Mycena sp. CBHHK59/15]|nr:hypothetical protein B0H10DRAFT_2235050 [Mycena sp. CBHHK59/15]